MSTTPPYVPPADEAVQLPVDELAICLLRLMHEGGRADLLNSNNVTVSGSWTDHGFGSNRTLFLQAIGEAWNWLESHGLVAPRPDGGGGWAFVTRKGLRVLDESEPLALVRAEERINLDLHPTIEQRVRRQFLLGEYETAAFVAMREVEIRVRALASASESDIGVNLMKQAFGKKGPLADPNLDSGERDATMALFWGAIGVFKNPSSHRQVEFDNPTVAAEVILLADLLLRMLDSIDERL